MKSHSDEHVNVLPHLELGAAGAERHAAGDVGAVGGERARLVSQPEEVLVDVGHGGFLQGHHHLVGGALNNGFACESHFI